YLELPVAPATPSLAGSHVSGKSDNESYGTRRCGNACLLRDRRGKRCRGDPAPGEPVDPPAAASAGGADPTVLLSLRRRDGGDVPVLAGGAARRPRRLGHTAPWSRGALPGASVLASGRPGAGGRGRARSQPRHAVRLVRAQHGRPGRLRARPG